MIAQDANIDWDEPFDKPQGPVFTIEEFIGLYNYYNPNQTPEARAVYKRNTQILSSLFWLT